MKKSLNQLNTREGFTIIEVVLVLAIAGLIFLMVFLALPALQRGQRDTQRKDDVARLQTALNSFQANNRNQIPSSGNDNVVAATVEGRAQPAQQAPARNTWGDFYDRYLLVNAGGQVDVFADPGGDPYSLQVMACSANGTPRNPSQGLAEGADCQLPAQRRAMTWREQVEGPPRYAIAVVVGAVCQGELAVASGSARKVAMLYKNEGGGATCINN
jgi:prepilin-type N-terminal cleavage/methylation domain-containing protein